jgi:hypothetical protein
MWPPLPKRGRNNPKWVALPIYKKKDYTWKMDVKEEVAYTAALHYSSVAV